MLGTEMLGRISGTKMLEVDAWYGYREEDAGSGDAGRYIGNN